MLSSAVNRARAGRKSEQGFTLIELLIVIVILGVLAGIVVFSVRAISDRGEESACKADVASVLTASEAYYAKNGSYATGIGVDSTSAATTLTGAGFLRSAPSNSKFTYAYTAASGSVASTPANCDLP